MKALSQICTNCESLTAKYFQKKKGKKSNVLDKALKIDLIKS